MPTQVRGTFFYLYLFVDVWSRRIMKAVVLSEESADNAARLLADACVEHQVRPQILTLHSDNGSPMKGSTMLATMQALGVVPSFSRPSVSNDNPYSEALFRTLKYVPSYPRKPFESIDAAWAWVERFVAWYNCKHRHSGIGDDCTPPDGVGTRGSGTRPPPCPSTSAIDRPALGRPRRSASERLRRRAWCRRPP